MKKKLLLAALALVLVFGAIGLTLLVIGEPVDGEEIAIEVEDLEGQVNIYISTPASALAFTDAHLRQEGNVLTIHLRQVLVSPLYSSGTKMIWLEKGTETEIWLGGKCIWTAEE